MRRHNILLTASILASGNGALAFSPTTKPRPPTSLMAVSSNSNRRNFLSYFSKAAAGAALVGITNAPSANALDMDAFENSLIQKDTTQCNPKLDPKCIPKLTPDEALCQYGVPGADQRSLACRRVRDAGGQLPGKSNGGERNTAGWVNNPIAL